MPSVRDYIPRANAPFNQFQNNLVQQVNIHATTWQIEAGKVAALNQAQADYQPFYNAIANRPTATRAGRADYEQARKHYEKFIRQFIKSFLAHNTLIAAADKVNMGIKPGRKTYTPRPAIHTAPQLLLKPLGNLLLRFEFRVTGDSTRPSMHPHSDALEIRYHIGDTLPANYTQVHETFYSTRAQFKRSLHNPAYLGKFITVFARWLNAGNEHKSGPWSEMARVMIS